MKPAFVCLTNVSSVFQRRSGIRACFFIIYENADIDYSLRKFLLLISAFLEVKWQEMLMCEAERVLKI